MEDERYIGRIESAFFKKGTYIHPRGYAICITSRRIIGYRRLAQIYKVMIGFEFADEREIPFSNEQNAKIIADIDNTKKDMELTKESITEIELRKPTTPFRGGHIKIKTNSEKDVHIKIQAYGNTEYLKIKMLMNRFAPDLVNDIEVNNPILKFRGIQFIFLK